MSVSPVVVRVSGVMGFGASVLSPTTVLVQIVTITEGGLDALSGRRPEVNIWNVLA